MPREPTPLHYLLAPAYLIGGVVCTGVGGLLIALALVFGIGSLAG